MSRAARQARSADLQHVHSGSVCVARGLSQDLPLRASVVPGAGGSGHLARTCRNGSRARPLPGESGGRGRPQMIFGRLRVSSGRLRTTRARMCPIRKPSASTDSQPAAPPCPGCHDSAFVKQEQVLTGGTAISFWTCSSCLRSWPAPRPRMAKADLNRSK